MHLALRTKALIGIAAVIGAVVIFGPSGSDTVPAAEHAGASPAAHRPSPATRPMERGAVYTLTGRVADAASAAALFASHSWYTPPPPPPPAPPPVIQAPPPPTAPPLPFSYMGSYISEGGVPVYFVTRNDRIYDLKAGDTVDGVYRFDGQKGNDLVFTYQPLNTQQTLATGHQ